MRGEIWTVAGGVYASKPRPAAIVQDDRFDALASVVVVPFTTTYVEADLLRVRVEATDESGIAAGSWAMIDKVTAVRASNLGERLGRLTDEQQAEIDRRMLVFLGLVG